MIKAVQAFQSDADGSDWAVVYFAGHGLEMDGRNDLVPTDAALMSDRNVEDEAVPLSRIEAAVSGARKLQLILLDACRNNPFHMAQTVGLKRSVPRGLARAEPNPGTLEIFATAAGRTADDGDREHSPFAIALLKELKVPHLEVRRLFDTVSDDLQEATGGQQIPYTYGRLSAKRDFYFAAK